MRYSIFALVAITMMSVGCASRSQISTLERQLREQQDRNFTLEQSQLDEADGVSDDEEATVAPIVQTLNESPVVASTANLPSLPPRPAPDFNQVDAAPTARIINPSPSAPLGPPQHWARAYRPPEVEGCDSGPFSLEIRNQTDWFLEVLLDGRQIRVFGADGNLPHLPPGQSAYVCLDNIGRHVVMGRAYQRRGAELIQVDDFQVTQNYGANPFHGRHRLDLNEGLFRWNPGH
ncbi:MAG: hypothetical protein V1738_06445 [Patescibacteria group bacterium]